jgi:acylglycerol lipase
MTQEDVRLWRAPMRCRALALVLCLLAGCSPGLGASPKLPVHEQPLGAEPGFSETTLRASDGLTLYARAWAPQGIPRASFVIVHGLRDHGDRYRVLARELNGRGIAVYAMDLRGHGRSEGARVSVDRLDRYVDDLALLIDRVRESSDAPLFLFGHSMGGAIAARYAEEPGHPLDGLVLSAPALRLFVSGVEECGVNLLADLSPQAPALALDMAKWSRRKEVIDENERDPLVYRAAAPVMTAAALIEGAREAMHEAPFVRVPLLVMHGSADGITDPAGSKAFVERARSSDKTLRVYPGLYHDLWNEPERELLTGDLIDWLNARLPDIAGDLPNDGAHGGEPMPDDPAAP